MFPTEDFTGEYSPLAGRLDSLAPGSELGGLLEGVDRDQLSGYEKVSLLTARARQIAYLQAQFYADLWSLTETEDLQVPGLDCYRMAAEEIRAALTWTRRAAERHLQLAYQLTVQFPQLGEALALGRIDLPKARVIIDALVGIDLEAARGIVDQVLVKAGSQTTGQIGARTSRLAITFNPVAAQARYDVSIENRRIELQANPTHTADLYALDLPTDRALKALDHVNQLAQALRIEGETRTMDQLRADVFLTLLEGGMVEVKNGSRRPVIDVRVDLTTLAQLDDNPGEVEGFGPVISDIARQLAQQDGSEWRVTVTHPATGHPMWNGVTRRRPTQGQRRRIAAYTPTCVAIGCRTPATRSDIDHHQPWHRGGPTIDHNLGPLCPHHHTIKDTGGWQLHQLSPGIYQWTSRLGRKYLVDARPP